MTTTSCWFNYNVLSAKCFQVGKSMKSVIWWKVREYCNVCYARGQNVAQLFTTQSRFLTTLIKKHFENIVGKGENAGNQHFLLFPQCFLPFSKQISIFQSHFFCCLRMLSIWTGLTFCRLVELSLSQTSPDFYVSAVQVFGKHCEKRRNCS